jgi:hypothetical protein
MDLAPLFEISAVGTLNEHIQLVEDGLHVAVFADHLKVPETVGHGSGWLPEKLAGNLRN